MWGRWGEIAIATWLASSPWIFGHAGANAAGTAVDVAAGAAVAALALDAVRHPGGRRRGLVAAIAVALVAAAFAAPQPSPTAVQNRIVVGLLLAMLALVPDRAARPPRRWREWLAERGEDA